MTLRNQFLYDHFWLLPTSPSHPRPLLKKRCWDGDITYSYPSCKVVTSWYYWSTWRILAPGAKVITQRGLLKKFYSPLRSDKIFDRISSSMFWITGGKTKKWRQGSLFTQVCKIKWILEGHCLLICKLHCLVSAWTKVMGPFCFYLDLFKIWENSYVQIRRF